MEFPHLVGESFRSSVPVLFFLLFSEIPLFNLTSTLTASLTQRLYILPWIKFPQWGVLFWFLSPILSPSSPQYNPFVQTRWSARAAVPRWTTSWRISSRKSPTKVSSSSSRGVSSAQYLQGKSRAPTVSPRRTTTPWWPWSKWDRRYSSKCYKL